MSNIGPTGIVCLAVPLLVWLHRRYVWLEVSAKAWGLGLTFCSVRCAPEPGSLAAWVMLPGITTVQLTVIINSNLKNNQ